MGEVASGIKAFQKGMKDDDKPAERIQTAAEVDAREVDKSKDA
jgi:sec-independent protein translocase protein TatA